MKKLILILALLLMFTATVNGNMGDVDNAKNSPLKIEIPKKEILFSETSDSIKLIFTYMKPMPNPDKDGWMIECGAGYLYVEVTIPKSNGHITYRCLKELPSKQVKKKN